MASPCGAREIRGSSWVGGFTRILHNRGPWRRPVEPERSVEADTKI